MTQCVTYIVTAIWISFHFNHTLCLVILLFESLYRLFEGTRSSEETFNFWQHGESDHTGHVPYRHDIHQRLERCGDVIYLTPVGNLS